MQELGVIALGRHCPDLEILLLGSCGNIGNEALLSVTEGCKKMRILGLGSCFNFTKRSLITIGNLLSLEKLNLSNTEVSDEALLAITGGCKSLHTLHLAGCNSLTQKGLANALASSGSLVEVDISRCPGLLKKEFLASLEHQHTKLQIKT